LPLHAAWSKGWLLPGRDLILLLQPVRTGQDAGMGLEQLGEVILVIASWA
jgi:hypothetical protein